MATGGLAASAASMLVLNLISSPVVGIAATGVRTALGDVPTPPVIAHAAPVVSSKMPRPVGMGLNAQVRTMRGGMPHAVQPVIAQAGTATRLTPAPQPSVSEPRRGKHHFNWPETLESDRVFLQRVRGALGCERIALRTRALQLSGGIRRRGQDERLSLDVGPGSQYVVRVEGAGTLIQGYDGTAGWSQTRSVANATLPLTYGNFQLPIWIQSGWWLAPGSPVRVAVDRTSSNSLQIKLKLSVSDSDRPAVMMLDRRTLRPIYLHVETTVGNESWMFNDYRRVDGQLIPHHMVYIGVAGRDIMQISSSAGDQPQPARNAARAANRAPVAGRPQAGKRVG